MSLIKRIRGIAQPVVSGTSCFIKMHHNKSNTLRVT